MPAKEEARTMEPIHPIRRRRHRFGLTQRQLSERAGVHYQHLSAWERGRVEPRAASVAIIAAALGVTARQLAGEIADWAQIRRGYSRAGRPR